MEYIKFIQQKIRLQHLKFVLEILQKKKKQNKFAAES